MASPSAAIVTVAAGALARAQNRGEVTTASSPAAQAQLVLLLFQGSALAGRAQLDKSRYIAGIDAALTALRAADPNGPVAGRRRARGDT